ncbi:MAG: hypothetical protein CVV32_10240 [Methanomicrobiales archaeon HGW-Methanomicrobiales-3]|jgi:hypothetical protein|nr:MAG: hypothetical protein CVV32_10240 [Methanomicrobiales archaeon HGW-Methanomicrobiales-3]
MIDKLFSFPGAFFIGLFAFILLFLIVGRMMRENSNPDYSYSHSFEFFSSSLDLMTIIGIIIAAISLAPVFLTFFLGDEWFHILLFTQMGILALTSIISATFASSVFIIILGWVIVARWIRQILLNGDVRLIEKIISFIILFVGSVAIFGLGWFLAIVWFTRYNAAISISGLTIFTFVFALISLILIAILIELSSYYPYGIRIVASILIVLFLILLIAALIIPTINNSVTIYNISSGYTVSKTFNLSFNMSRVTTNSESPNIFLIDTDFTEFDNSHDINKDYYDCHWSTNYGNFITIDTITMLTQKRSDEFLIPKCVQNPKYKIYWTYDSSDYLKQKPPVIISLQVENSNRRLAFEKLGEPVEYSVGSNYSYFIWNQKDDLILNDTVRPNVSNFFAL